MGTQEVEFDGDLWFFTRGDSEKVSDVERDSHVNVSYASPNNQCYISISGTAHLTRDEQKKKELWNPIYKAWFPDGLDDPELALLKISVEQAEYWESPSSVVVRLVGFAKAVVTGNSESLGKNEKIDLPKAAGVGG